MGLMKSLYTELHSARGNKAAVRQRVQEAEHYWRERTRMSFMTDVEYRDHQLRRIKRDYATCKGCGLCEHRSRVVLGEGGLEPLLMIVGEAPGQREDEVGRPFVGPSGFLLRKICSALELDLDRDAYMTNTVLCRPPNNRAPRVEEQIACRRRLDLQQDTLQPLALLLLGATAMQLLEDLPRDARVSDFRGLVPKRHWPRFHWTRLRAVYLGYHPSYVLHQETKGKKRMALAKVVHDLKQVKRLVDALRAWDASFDKGGR